MLKQLHFFQIPVSASEVAPAVSTCVLAKQLCMNCMWKQPVAFSKNAVKQCGCFNDLLWICIECFWTICFRGTFFEEIEFA